MSEQNKSIVNQAYSNFQSGDINGILNLLADNVSWELPEMEGVPFAGKRNGRAGVGEFFAALGASQEPVKFDPQVLIAEDDRVVALGTYEWKVKSTSRDFRGDFAHAWTIRDGKVVAFHEYTDTAACRDAYKKAMSA